MKKIKIATLLVIFTLGLVTNAYALTAFDLWPVQRGNEWTYEIQGQINNGKEFQVKVTRRSGGWAYLDGTDEFYGTDWGDRWWWMSRYSGNIYTWNPAYFSYSRVFNLSVGTGHQFTSRIIGVPCLNGSVWMVVDEHGTVDTPVGTFNDCLIIENIDPPCVDAGMTRMVFAPDVGPVEYSWTTIAGGHTARLVHAIVNGTEYKRIPEAKGFSVCLNIDKITYVLTENHMPPVPEDPPQYPDTLSARLKIENNTTETITFTHSSSQEYDFVIRDDSGNEVYRWSNGKAFLTVIIDRTLPPGKSLVYEEDIELRDNEGDPIPPGSYTVQGIHTTMPGELRNMATAAFKIDLSIVY